jgi:tetratricopeptide (TPR) repeat protein
MKERVDSALRRRFLAGKRRTFSVRRTVACLIVLGALLAGSPLSLWAQGPETSQELLARGYAAFQAERYQESLELFQRVYKEQPTSALVNFYLGVNLRALQRPTDAVPFLTESLARDSALTQAHYQLGVSLYQAKRLEEALTSFREAEKHFPKSAVLYYYEGLILVELGRTQEAIGPLEKAGELDKAFLGKATFLRGMAYYRLSQPEQAKKAFQSIRDLEPGTALAEDAERNIRALEADARPPKRFFFTITGGFQYDTNVVLRPNGFSFLNDLTPSGPLDIPRKDDGRAMVAFRGEYRHPFTESIEAGVSYATVGALHANLSNLNLNSHNPAAYLGLRAAPFYLRVEYDYLFSFLGNDSSVGFHSVGPTTYLSLHPVLMTEAYLRFRDKTFFGNHGRYSDNYTVGGNQYFYVLGPGGYLRLGYQYQEENARFEEYDSEASTFSGGFMVPLPWGLEALGEGSYERRNYDNDFFGLGTRDEDLYTASGTLMKDLGFIFENLSGSLNYTRVRNDSNVGDFDYEQDIFGGYLTYEY